jgi:hypothetical protein
VATKWQVDANWRVNLLAAEVGILRCLGGAEQGFGLVGLCLVSEIGSKLLVLKVVTVEEMNEALSNLEKVTVGLVGRKFNVELEGALCADFLLCRRHIEGVLHVFTGGLIEDLKQSPVDTHREAVFVVD